MMFKFKQATTSANELTGVICDRCKEEYPADSMEREDFHYIRIDSRYSSAFGDGNIVKCDLCSDCLHELIGSFCRYNE